VRADDGSRFILHRWDERRIVIFVLAKSARW